MTSSDSAPRLSALEAAFLGLESRDVPFVHASILSFDRPLALDEVRAHVDASFADLPRYRQRMVRGRLGLAAWVADPDYKIERHIQIATAPTPGGPRELDELAAHLLAIEMAPEHPQWRLWTVHGLADRRGAVIAVFHHSLIDGIAGFRLLEHVLRARPSEPERPPHRAEAPGRLAAVRQIVARRTVTALGRLLRDGLSPASQLGINPRHTGHVRMVASHTVELAAIDQIGAAFGATNNDVVLATVAGALRRMLRRRGVEPDQLHDVRAMVPVGRHPRHGAAPVGNRVVLLIVPLPVDEPDPVTSLHRVTAATHRLKSGQTATGGDLLVALSEATTPMLLVGVLRLALRLRAFNVLVTNVPGPSEPLSLAGARLTRIVPIVNLWPHQALGIAAASYAGMMSFGIQTDRHVVPDADRFRDDLAATFDALRDAAARSPSAPPLTLEPPGQVRAMHRPDL